MRTKFGQRGLGDLEGRVHGWDASGLRRPYVMNVCSGMLEGWWGSIRANAISESHGCAWSSLRSGDRRWSGQQQWQPHHMVWVCNFSALPAAACLLWFSCWLSIEHRRYECCRAFLNLLFLVNCCLLWPKSWMMGFFSLYFWSRHLMFEENIRLCA